MRLGVPADGEPGAAADEPDAPADSGVPDRRPPRRPEPASCVDVRDAVFASPERARSLLTVRAAISSARFSDHPCFFWLALMCWYCRSRLGLLPAGIAHLLVV